MRRCFWIFPPITLLLLGCGGEKTTPTPDPAAVQIATSPVPAPDFEQTSKLKLIADGREVHVGMQVGDAEMVFPRPPNRPTFRDVPPGFGPEYDSKGWETDAEGFGMISLGGQVVTAVHTEQGVKEPRVEEILRKYRIGLDSGFSSQFDVQAPAASRSWARYWFAEDGQDRLMVCAVRLKTGVLNITEAIGFNRSMDALRMGKKQAENDLERASSKKAS